MRVSYYFFILVCMLLLVTANPTLQDRLSSKSSTVNQKYVLLRPVSSALSYIYLTKQTLSSTASPHITDGEVDSKTNTDYDTLHLAQQVNAKNSMVIKSSSSAVDTNHHNGPVTALALVLFFCVLSF